MDIMVYHAHTIGYDYTHGIECYSDVIVLNVLKFIWFMCISIKY